LEINSRFSIGRREKEANVNGKIHGNFVGQSTTMKLAEFQDRGRVLDYVESFPHWILITTRPGDASENSIDDRRRKINAGRFFSALLGSLLQI
jgi:hypothetical protein